MRFTGLDRAHASLLSAAIIMSLSSAPTFAAASQADRSAANESVQVKKGDSEGTVKVTPPSPAAAAESLALIKQAYSNMAAGNWPEATNLLSRALRTDTGSVLGRRYLAFCLLQTDRAHDAQLQLDSLDKLNSPISFDYIMRGDALTQLGESDKATEAYRKALEMTPRNDSARGKLIEALRQDGKFQEATALCAEGYFASRVGPVKQHYLSLFNEINQQRVLMAQHNLGIQMEHTTSFPMILPILPAKKSSTALDNKRKDADAKADAEADSDADADEDTAKLPPPPPNVRNYK